MARSNKFVIEVFPARTSQTIKWQGHGKHGTLLLAKTKGAVTHVPITGGLDEHAYWLSVLAQVQNGIPFGS